LLEQRRAGFSRSTVNIFFASHSWQSKKEDACPPRKWQWEVLTTTPTQMKDFSRLVTRRQIFVVPGATRIPAPKLAFSSTFNHRGVLAPTPSRHKTRLAFATASGQETPHSAQARRQRGFSLTSCAWLTAKLEETKQNARTLGKD
jgi:hypothetical protein